MKHTDFMSLVLDEIVSRLDSMPIENLSRLALKNTDSVNLDSTLVISLVHSIAPRYKCDIAMVLQKHDYPELAKQIASILMRFGRAYARKCGNIDNTQGTCVMYSRFINTYSALRIIGHIPKDLPDREELFFLDPDDEDYAKADVPGHGLTGDHLRKSVGNWDITKRLTS